MQVSKIAAIRGRIIPIIAVSLVVGLLALLAWTLLAPKPADTAEAGRINAPGVFVPIGDRNAPDFTITDFNTGKKVSLSDYRGKTVVINFWASWCPPCQTEAPLLNNYVSEHNSGNFVVLGVAIWSLSSDSEKFVQQYGLSYINGQDNSGMIAIDYGVAGVPESFVVGPDGKIVGKFPGAVTTPEQLTDALKESTGG